MAALFVFVAVPFLIDSLTDPKDSRQAGQYQPVKLIRRVAEDEVIAEFLKGDFDHPAFRPYRKTLRDMVLKPNLSDSGENTIRRALLFHQASGPVEGNPRRYEVVRSRGERN